jgi:hypothetical protein
MLVHVDSAVWLLAAVQLASLVAAMAARHHQGKRGERLWQGAFLLCLPLAGVATLWALVIGPGACILCGAVQAASVITTVWEFRGATHLSPH